MVDVIEELLIAREGRAKAIHDRIMFAREEIRQRLGPDSPVWLRNVFDELHAAHHILSGDPFDMHMRAALAAEGLDAAERERDSEFHKRKAAEALAEEWRKAYDTAANAALEASQ